MSELNREQFETVVELTDAYLRGDLGVGGFAQLQAMLVKSPAAAQAAIEYLAQAGMMREVLSEQSQPEAAAARPELREYLAILHDLEPTGPLPAVVIQDPLSSDAHGRQGQGNFAMRAFTQPWFWVGSGIAAVFAVAVTLAVVFSGNSTPSGLTVNTPSYTPQSTPDTSAVPAPAIVATLTATHNAQWAEGPFAPGDNLHPNQRLTLITGFAQITTARGAVAILEAPATIELTDNDNALRLHAGKLVGICEVPSSHGFTVHTPLAKVRDIGTRFSVQQADGRTQISVLSGEVFATATDRHDNTPVSLTAGQHAEVTQATGQLVRIDRPDTRYVDAWSAVADRPRLTGEVRYEPAMPLSLLPGDEEDNLPVVFAERSRVSLPAGFEVTLASPGTYVHDTAFKQVALGDDAIVDCYFIHFDPPDQLLDGRRHLYQERTATIHFDRPIVGVITLPEHLLASAARLDRPGVRYRPDRSLHPAPPLEGLDVTNIRVDIIRLSADRRTLEFTLHAGPSIDQFRVLVQSHPEQAQ